MASRPSIKEFAKAQTPRGYPVNRSNIPPELQREYNERLNRARMDEAFARREQRYNQRGIGETFIGPGAANMTTREIDQAFRTGSVTGALADSAQRESEASMRLGMPNPYPGDQFGPNPYLAASESRRTQLGLPESVLFDGRNAYADMMLDANSARQLNVPLSALQSRQAQILQQQQAALSAGAPAREADANYNLKTGQGALFNAQAGQTTAMTPAMIGSAEAEAERRRAEAALFGQQANSLGQMTGAQMQAIQQGGGRVLPPELQYIQQPQGPSEVDIAKAEEMRANAAKAFAEANELKSRIPPIFAMELEALQDKAGPLNPDKNARAAAMTELVRRTQEIRDQMAAGATAPAGAGSGGISGQSSTGVPWQLNQ